MARLRCAAIVLTAACSSPATSSNCTQPRAAGTIQDPELVELSGLAAASSGAYYAHNDSGDVARLFVVGSAGEAIGRLVLTGATATDWEDIASAPCTEGRCIWIGDTGDNDLSRATTTLYRVVEPAVVSGTIDVAWQAITMTSPHPINGESLFVDPRDGTMYSIDKTDATVYRAELDTDTAGHWLAIATLELKGGQTSGADLDVTDAGVARLLVRTDHRLFELDGDTVAGVLGASPVEVPVADEANGEAVAWLLDGSGYVTASEGTHPVLSIVTCE